RLGEKENDSGMRLGRRDQHVRKTVRLAQRVRQGSVWTRSRETPGGLMNLSQESLIPIGDQARQQVAQNLGVPRLTLEVDRFDVHGGSAPLRTVRTIAEVMPHPSGAETPLGTERAQGLMARTAASRAVPEETSACGEVPSYDADAGTPPRSRGRRESARAPGPLLHLAGTRGGGLRRWRRRRRPPGDRPVRRGDYGCADARGEWAGCDAGGKSGWPFRGGDLPDRGAGPEYGGQGGAGRRRVRLHHE